MNSLAIKWDVGVNEKTGSSFLICSYEHTSNSIMSVFIHYKSCNVLCMPYVVGQ